MRSLSMAKNPDLSKRPSPAANFAAAAIAVVFAAGFVGCKSNANQATLSITIAVDSTLVSNLDTVRGTVNSSGKSTSREFVPADELHWTVFVANPTKGQLVTVTAEGVRTGSDGGSGGTVVVSYSAQASLGPGETVDVSLKLTADCSLGLVCSSGDNCDDGVCKPQPVFSGTVSDGGGLDTSVGGGAGVGARGGAMGAGGAAGGSAGAGGAGMIGGAGGTSGIGGAAGAAAASGNGGTGTPTGGAGGSPLAVGSSCAVAGDCSTGFCVDGVCCAQACSGCNACSQALTGKSDGICAPVSSGTDPHNACADQTATNQCGDDGTCDGSGACRKVSTSHQCTPPSCNGATFTSASNCDGLGSCTTPTVTMCGAFQCVATTGCKKACAAQTDCDGSSYCDTTAATCSSKKADGTACAAAVECTSGNCIDGVCCHTTCSGCNACSTALTGQASGQCLPVLAGTSAHNACTAAGTTCGEDGTCDGHGSCRFAAHGAACGSSCSGSSLTPMACDGSGACVAGTKSACPGSLVCANTTACKSSCTANSDCVTANCSGGACGPTKTAIGGKCSVSTDCVAGASCVDATCCAKSSCPTCQACNIAGSLGACFNKAPGAADAACAATSSNCMTGACNGSGACQPAAATTSCGANVCTNGPEDTTNAPGQWTTPTFQRRLCDGTTAGSAGCKLGTNQGCTGKSACASASACLTSCTRDADCLGGFYCSGNACVARIQTGQPCTHHNQCLSRVCSTSGVCVDCAGNDDCPVDTPVCCGAGGGFCAVVGVCDDYYPGANGSINCVLSGFCGNRHSICVPSTTSSDDGSCTCGQISDCPVGTICKTDGSGCFVNGGQPCVKSSDCLSGICSSNGVCGTSAAGALCANDDASTGRPTGCAGMCSPAGDGGSLPNSICM
jgi:hypothetical protein